MRCPRSLQLVPKGITIVPSSQVQLAMFDKIPPQGNRMTPPAKTEVRKTGAKNRIFENFMTVIIDF